MFGRTKAPKSPQPEIAQELRAFEDRLLGWKVSGTSAPDLHSLLLRAADEIEHHLSAPLSGGEPDE